MCSSTWMGWLRKIVYASSSKQLKSWMEEFGASISPVKTIPIENVINNAQVVSATEEFSEILKEYQKISFLRKQKKKV